MHWFFIGLGVLCIALAVFSNINSPTEDLILIVGGWILMGIGEILSRSD